MDSCSATAEPSDRCGWNEVGQSSGAHTFAPTRTRTDNNDDDDVGNARRTMPSKTESGGGGATAAVQAQNLLINTQQPTGHVR